MARKSIKTTIDTTDPIPDAVTEVLTQTQQTIAVIQGAHSDERDMLNQMMGQVQMTGALAKLTTVIGLTKLAQIKETKMYRALQGKTGVDREGAEIDDVGTWEGFCRAIGSTKSKVDEDLLNLKAFGEEALSDLSRVGAGYRELRQLRKLPEDAQSMLIEAAKAGDKDSFVDLAEEIITRHAQEKEGLTARAVEAEQAADEKEKVLAEKNQKLDEMAVKLQRIKKLPANEVTAQLRAECSTYADQVEELIRHQLRAAFTAINDNALLNPDLEPEHRDYLATRLDLLDDALLFLRGQLGIERTRQLTNEPEWATDEPESLFEKTQQ